MRKEFILAIKPFSINGMYYGDARTKTQAARDWSYKVLFELSKDDNSQKLEELRNYFDPEKHEIHLELTANYPRKVFLNKQGTISSRAQDLSNWEKPLIDLFFDSRYFDQPSPYGCKNLNTNDKYVTVMSSKKTISKDDEFSIEFNIEIKDSDWSKSPRP